MRSTSVYKRSSEYKWVLGTSPSEIDYFSSFQTAQILVFILMSEGSSIKLGSLFASTPLQLGERCS